VLLQELPGVLQILKVVLEYGLCYLRLALLSNDLAEVGLVAILEVLGHLCESWAC